MNMRNATCVGTETSKVPTRVTLLFIFYSVVRIVCFHLLSGLEQVNTTVRAANVGDGNRLATSRS